MDASRATLVVGSRTLTSEALRAILNDWECSSIGQLQDEVLYATEGRVCINFVLKTGNTLGPGDAHGFTDIDQVQYITFTSVLVGYPQSNEFFMTLDITDSAPYFFIQNLNKAQVIAHELYMKNRDDLLEAFPGQPVNIESRNMLMVTAERSRDAESWNRLCKEFPAFNMLTPVLKSVKQLGPRVGLAEYCASKWYFGEQGVPSSTSVPAMGLKRAALSIVNHYETKGTPVDQAGLTNIIWNLLPPCDNPACKVASSRGISCPDMFMPKPGRVKPIKGTEWVQEQPEPESGK